jgi:kinesin family protein C2/C3
VQEPDSDGAASPFRVTLQAELTKNKADLAAKTQECAALRDTVASATTRASEAEVALKKQADESSRTEANLRQELEAVSLRSREGLEEYASRELVATEQANKAVVVLNAELASIRLRSEQQEQGHEAEKGELRSRIRELEAELVSINAQASSAVDDTAERLKQQLASLKLEMEAERDALVADLTARHATDKEHALTELRLELELLATTREAIAVASTLGEWDQDISALRERQAGELATACESVRTEARALAEAELSRQLVSVRAQHEEFVQQLQASLNAEKTAALESLHESLAAEHSARVDELRQSHAEDLQRALLQKQTEAEAALADALSKAHEQSEERLTSALKELSDAKDQFLEDTMASATKIHLEEKALLTERLDALSRQLDETLKGLEESVRIAVFTAESLKEEQHAAAMTALRLEMQGAVDAAAEERDEYLRLYSKERDQRKVLHNRLLEIQGNIRVLCRVRPVLDVERRQGSGAEVDVTEVPAEDLLIIQRDPATRTRFEFDRVFTQGSGQEEVFAAVQPLCVSVLDGFNVRTTHRPLTLQTV